MATRSGDLSEHFKFVVVLVGFGVFVLLLGFKNSADQGNYRLRECVFNLESIAARQDAVLAATGRYLSCGRFPAEIPDADHPPTWRPACDLGHKVWTWRYDNGKRQIEAEFLDGRENGIWASWYETGRIKERGQYSRGVKTGLWTTWPEDGEIYEDEDFGADTGAAGDGSRTALRSDAALSAAGGKSRFADCKNKWQCHESHKVCWSQKARQRKDRDPASMETVPECWRQLMGLGRKMVLRGQYEVNAPAVAAQGRAMQRFEATCRIDLKGDGEVTVFRATESRKTWKDEVSAR